MKLFLALILSSSFVFIGFLSAERQRKCTKALGNAVDFISTVKTELRFKNADFSSICRLLDNGSFSFLSSENETISLSTVAGEENTLVFSEFIKRIGTTDGEGQILLCDEYKEKLFSAYEAQKKKEREKIQVNSSLSLLGALCSFIFFL